MSVNPIEAGQLTLEFTTARARHADPETSRAAATSVRTTDLESRVLATLQRLGSRGATTTEMATRLNVSQVTVSPRFAPLVRKGRLTVASVDQDLLAAARSYGSPNKRRTAP